MANNDDYTSHLDQEILVDLGARLRAARLQANLTQDDVAARASLNRATVANAEAGHDPRLGTVVRILRAIGRLDALHGFLVTPTVSPMQLLRSAGRPRQRASRKRDG